MCKRATRVLALGVDASFFLFFFCTSFSIVPQLDSVFIWTCEYKCQHAGTVVPLTVGTTSIYRFTYLSHAGVCVVNTAYYKYSIFFILFYRNQLIPTSAPKSNQGVAGGENHFLRQTNWAGTEIRNNNGSHLSSHLHTIHEDGVPFLLLCLRWQGSSTIIFLKFLFLLLST